jgi:hypothetical protein
MQCTGMKRVKSSRYHSFIIPVHEKFPLFIPVQDREQILSFRDGNISLILASDMACLTQPAHALIRSGKDA